MISDAASCDECMNLMYKRANIVEPFVLNRTNKQRIATEPQGRNMQ